MDLDCDLTDWVWLGPINNRKFTKNLNMIASLNLENFHFRWWKI